MANGTDLPRLDRVSYFDGQRLTAADLSEAQRAQRELRWLHNRSLHAWGVAFGLAVSGQEGDTAVTVSPGYALDAHGREIVLTEPRSLPVPPVAGDDGTEAASFVLTIAYPGEDDLVENERRGGACSSGGAVRLATEPRLAWGEYEPDDVGSDVVLAQAGVRKCRLAEPLSFSLRRSARPVRSPDEEQIERLVRRRPGDPYIASGEMEVLERTWELIPDGADERNAWGVSIQVDTTSARFRSTPNYQAHVVGERVFSAGPQAGSYIRPGFHAGSRPYLRDGFFYIRNPTQVGFELDVLLPRNLPVGPEISINPPAPIDNLEDIYYISGEFLKIGNWRVIWMGVEM
jgi:hypothetical protein